MKNTIRYKLLFLLALAFLTMTANAQVSGTPPPPPKQLTLTFELNDLPGRDAPGSFWEVSYQWRIADRRDFDRWSAEGANPGKQNSLGILLTKDSFTRRNLSAGESRRVTTVVPVKGPLSERLRNAAQRSQIVWLDATVRIHDGKLGTDIIKKVNPAWGPDFYRVGAATVRMEVTQQGTLRWSRRAVPAWNQSKQYSSSTIRMPPPE